MHKPTDSVRIVAFDPNDISRFPIVQEADDLGNWKLPGGSFNTNTEDPVTAGRRELREELGVDDVKFLGGTVIQNDDGHSARHVFSALIDPTEVRSPDPSDTDPERVTEVKWVTAKTVPNGKNRNHIVAAHKVAHAALIAEGARRILAA